MNPLQRLQRDWDEAARLHPMPDPRPTGLGLAYGCALVLLVFAVIPAVLFTLEALNG